MIDITNQLQMILYDGLTLDFSTSVCVCMVYVYMWVQMYTPVCACGGQRRALGVLLNYFLPYFFETESLPEPEFEFLG